MPYLFLDGDASILTAASSIVSGAHRPIVEIGSVLSIVPTTFSGSPSISGAVTIVGNPSISGTVNIGTIPGSVVSFQGGGWTASLVSTAPSSVLVGASIFGQLPAGTAVLGSVATLQGTNPWITTFSNSSVLATQQGTVVTSLVSTVPSSVIVGASIFGQLPAGTAVLGSVTVLQGTNPWVIGSVSGSVGIVGNPSISGTVNIAGNPSISGTVNISGNPSISGTVNIGIIPGSVVAFQGGTLIASVVGSIPSSLLTGVHGHRNDAVASYLGGDLSWRPIATDSAGRPLTKPFAAEESRVEGYVTLTSTSLTTLVAAAGAGLRNYITDLWFANTGATTTLITFSDSAASILGYTVAPTASGSNLPGLFTPIRTGANASFNIQAGSNTSTLYATVKGFKAP